MAEHDGGAGNQDGVEPDGGAELVELADIRTAAERIRPYAVRTPLLRATRASAAPPGRAAQHLWLKPECFQPIGAFKIRGATNAIATLDEDARARGVVAHSSGNHAQAVAFAARAFGCAAHIVIPANAPEPKVEATRRLGATVELVPVSERVSRAEKVVADTGMTMIPPFDHRDVIAGQGTIGLEIAEDLAGVTEQTTVLVPVSGGGLISGIAAALAALRPEVQVIGVEPELAADAAESLRVGRRVAWRPEDTVRTCADGLRMFSLGTLPWAHIRRLVPRIVTVSEDEILAAVRTLALDEKIVAEPSGAVPVAAHLFHADELPTGRHIAVVSGGNVDPTLLARVLAEPVR